MKFNSSWIFLLLSLVYMVCSTWTLDGLKQKRIIYSEFLDKLQSNEVESVEIRNGNILGKFHNGDKFFCQASYIVDYHQLLLDLRQKDVTIRITTVANKLALLESLMYWVFLLLVVFFVGKKLRNFSAGDDVFGGFFKFRAKLLQAKCQVTFNDVAGIDEAKEELRELVDFLKDPEKYTDIGARIPKGCLLVGLPGTGKTLLAKAVAGEASVPFYFISGSEFVEVFVGVGASRVREVFAEAKKHAPCLIFIDEIDAIGRRRSTGFGGGNEEKDQTLNQLLVEMDGFENNEGVIVIAATNRGDVLDKALIRPGRFDRQISIQLPDVKGREEILLVHAKKVRMAPNVNLKLIAKSTSGYSGAELANIINEAGLLAARLNRKVITNTDLEEAQERVSVGVKNQNRIKKEEEMKLVAHHEAGHALVALNCPNVDPIQKATIISRGSTAGYVSMPAENDGRLTAMTKACLLDDITVAMGGRMAEKVIFGENKITVGAMSDLKSATEIAKNMVSRYGMSDKIGPIYWVDKLQGDDSTGRWESGSPSALNILDGEVRNLLLSCAQRAEKIIRANRAKLVLLAEALLKYETLTGEEIAAIVEGQQIFRDESSSIVVESVSPLVEIVEESTYAKEKKV
jgi:cell division protease FtsH